MAQTSKKRSITEFFKSGSSVKPTREISPPNLKRARGDDVNVVRIESQSDEGSVQPTGTLGSKVKVNMDEVYDDDSSFDGTSQLNFAESVENKDGGSTQDRSVDASVNVKARKDEDENELKAGSDSISQLHPASPIPSTHSSYPHPIAALPPPLLETLLYTSPSDPGKPITSRPDLDLLTFNPYIPPSIQTQLFHFLRSELPFYRVKYKIKRGTFETEINTPRYTTVFGVDATSIFADVDSTSTSNNASTPLKSPPSLLDSTTRVPVPYNTYKCTPRPIPSCLDSLRLSIEAHTGTSYNFCLVNYYANGSDSISYHSDDERFLGAQPCIASFSLGSARDFLLRHKDSSLEKSQRDMKISLKSGDCIIMRGKTQERWLHSIPKRSDASKGGGSDLGRINITFRKALVKGGTENYYRYNVGEGEVWRWDHKNKEMRVWEGMGK